MSRKSIAALSLSAAALVGIVAHEGYVQDAYQDIVGVWTIGYGTTEGVKQGQKTDPVKALQRALTDINTFEGALKQCVKVPLHQYEYDAYISFAYNVGTTAFCKSTLVRLLNEGKYEDACRQLDRWVYAGGKKVNGLVNRRQEEKNKCLGL